MWRNKAQWPTMRPQVFWGISSYLNTAIATFGGRYARELFWYYLWLSKPSWSFLYIEFSISCIFHENITYGPTDRPTDCRTDTPFYRDARMHLKIALMILKVTSRGVSTENVSQFSPALWAVWGLLSILPHLLQFGYISNCVFLTLLTSQNGHPLL